MLHPNKNLIEIYYSTTQKNEKNHETFQQKRYLRIENTIKNKIC